MINKLEIFKKKLIYRSNYRGTKEMDILLGQFVKKYIDEFNEAYLNELENFLKYEDEVILNFYQQDIIKEHIDQNKVSKIAKLLDNATLLREYEFITATIDEKIVSENNIFLSTYCEEISKIGKDLGVQIIKRPQNLAEDNSSEWLAWQHAINWVLSKHGAFDIFLSLPSTARFLQSIPR